MSEMTLADFEVREINRQLCEESCAVCGGDVVHDGYGECEQCHAFTCAEHNNLVKGLCPDCRKEKGE